VGIGMAQTIENAYQWCEQLAHSHYENFPVASLLLPKRIRRPIAVIYAFARTVDDIVDEGTASAEERVKQLEVYWKELELIEQGKAVSQKPLFIALQQVIYNHQLPLSLLFDLLRAFQQDIHKKTYSNFQEILSYCRHSANPVGRLLLHLTQQATPDNCKHSDAVCTALQLINFLQDISSDLHERERCYLPQDEMQHLNITTLDLMAQTNNKAVRQLIDTQWSRANALMQEGSALGRHLKGLFGLEIRFIIESGFYILQALKKRQTPYSRPILSKRQLPLVLWRALKNRCMQ
jgi:squalene synthase HpnC